MEARVMRWHKTAFILYTLAAVVAMDRLPVDQPWKPVFAAGIVLTAGIMARLMFGRPERSDYWWIIGSLVLVAFVFTGYVIYN